MATQSARTRRITTNAATPTIERLDIGPEFAANLLTQKARNRSLSPGTVARYARDMVAGRWKDNAATILFDYDNNLLDGQHRLQAIIEADVTLPMFVARGVAPDVMQSVDTGRGRTAADALQIRGEAHSAALGATGRLALSYRLWEETPETGNLADIKNMVSVGEVIDYIDAHPTIRLSPELVCPLSGKGGKVIPVSALCLVHHIASTHLKDLADTFAEEAATGEGLEADSPVLVLRNKFLRQRRHRIQLEATYMDRITWVVQGWNAFAEGRTVAYIRSRKRRIERFPRIVGG